MSLSQIARNVAVVSALLALSSTADATSLISNPGVWEQTVTFDGVPLSNNQPVTNEFSSKGVTFGPGLQWFHLSSGENWAGATGSILFEGFGDEYFPTLSISFAALVSSAGFNFRAGDATRNPVMLFTALRDGIEVDSFSANVTTSQVALPEQFFGFTGVVFNQITIDMVNPVPGPPCCGANIDNVSFNVASPVPEPETAAMMIIGFAMVAFAKMRKSDNAKAI